MIDNQLFRRYSRSLLIGLIFAITSPLISFAQAAAGQKTFPTPSAAAAALAAACRSGDEAELLAILGPDGKDLISSGDPVADKKAQQGFVKSYTTKHSLTA